MSNSDDYQGRHAKPEETPPRPPYGQAEDDTFWQAVNHGWDPDEEKAAATRVRKEAADWLHGAMQRARDAGKGDMATTFAVRAARIRQGKSI